MILERGALGQFDVFVDGEVIASRGGNLLQRVLGGGWPDPDDVIDRIESIQAARAKG